MKRPEIPRYVPPPLRSNFSKECEDEMEYTKGQYASEAANMQSYSFGKHESSKRISTDMVPRRVRIDSSSSSSNPKNTSDESCKDEDSSDFSDCSDGNVPMSHLKIRKESSEEDSFERWKQAAGWSAKNDDGIEIENYEIITKISNNLLMQHKDHSDLKSHSNQELNFESNEKKFDRGLFYNYGDSSISDIEATIDSYTKKRSVLTSTPNSDIVDERVLDAAKYVPQGESAMESTLLFQNDTQTTINTNRNDCDYKFEFYHDLLSVEKQQKDYSEMFGNNYIPPPVPPPQYAFQLPPIHRLKSPVSSPYESSGPRLVFPRLSIPYHLFPQLHMPQLPTQERHPRLLIPPSLQRYPDFPRRLPYKSSYISHTPCRLSSPSVQPGSDPGFSILSPRSPQRSVISQQSPQRVISQQSPQRVISQQSPQRRVISQHSPQDMFNPPNLESCNQGGSFYIPPPKPTGLNFQIRNLNQRQDEQNYTLYTQSFMNRVAYDPKIWPRGPK